mmetsp:Transcript_23517/g.28970  ORF Transcript_23517/g.28970 Transcript_23517/m.28970 type:complete len:252 (+) Transcript_23517:346-1101(+)
MWIVGKLDIAEVDKLEMNKVKRFYIVPFAFLATIFANIKILQHANVETFIVFRVSTPLIISLLEYKYLGRELPSRRSWLCLFFLLIGGISYVAFDKFFSVDAYFWVVIWYAVFTFDQVYIKHIVDAVPMTTWGRVYYTNLIASVPLLFVLILTGEFNFLREFEWERNSVLALGVSCVMGTAIAWFAFEARRAISAAYFTVIGNTCKVLTVLLNHFMWEYHATPGGIASLMICLVAAYFYKQAPKRSHGLPN